MPDPAVVVIGAGMAGLVSALQLASRGVPVMVVEAADAPGGKIRQLPVNGAPIDSGPTVFTLRWIFDEVLASVGTRLEDEVRITPLSVLARHFWDPEIGGGNVASLDLLADARASHDAVARFAGPDEARRFTAFCAQAREVYATLEGPFIRSTSPTMGRMVGDLGLRGLSVLARLGPMRSLWDSLGRHFTDPRLRQLFGRYATYCGSSPWEAPATLMLIAQVEMDGVWAVEGGMHALARMLERLARAQGVTFRYGTACERIELQGGRVSGVQLATGERVSAQRVVFNGDVAALHAGLLGDAPRAGAPRVGPRSLSAVTWSMHTRAPGLALDRHNVFFTGDYRSEFADIFGQDRLPHRPTVYLCAQDRGTGVPDTGAPQRLLALVNAPAVGGQGRLTREALDECDSQTFSLMHRCGLALQPQAHEVVRTTPDDFHRLFPGTGGALYGQATHGWNSAFARSPATSPVPGLFLAGGSVHPGPGVPMAAMSGQLAAAAVMASLGSTSRSRAGATSGGMSTHSATTERSA
jgi:1-hydroxycarotenoid 3,4-desaturase